MSRLGTSLALFLIAVMVVRAESLFEAEALPPMSFEVRFPFLPFSMLV